MISSNLLRGRPRRQPTGPTLSTSGSNCVTSWRLAPVSVKATGVPRASVSRWCLEPFFLRSTGLFPVFFPRASHGRKSSRPRRGAPHGSGLGKYRFVVERAESWVHQYRRLKLRYDRDDAIHEAFLSITCTLICLDCWENPFC